MFWQTAILLLKLFNGENDLEGRVDRRTSDEASIILNEYDYSSVNVDNLNIEKAYGDLACILYGHERGGRVGGNGIYTIQASSGLSKRENFNKNVPSAIHHTHTLKRIQRIIHIIYNNNNVLLARYNYTCFSATCRVENRLMNESSLCNVGFDVFIVDEIALDSCTVVLSFIHL